MQQKPDKRPASSTKSAPESEAIDLIAVSQAFLNAMKLGEVGNQQYEALVGISNDCLNQKLIHDDAKKAFWINVYNAIHLYQARQAKKSSWSSKYVHFFQRSHKIGGILLSLNDIEHSILRHSQWWWARGYLKKPFERKALVVLRVKSLDPRIHFTLNCGATSCPAIMSYSAEAIDHQLDFATKAFMNSEVDSKENNTIEVSGLFAMYKGDFGGKAGVRSMIERYRPDLNLKDMRIRFLPFDWTPFPHKFIEVIP